MRKRNSKVLALMLTMTLLMSLMVGCNKGDDVATTEVATTQEVTEVATTEVASTEENMENASSEEQLDSMAEKVILSEEETWEYNGASVTYYDEIVETPWLTTNAPYTHIKDNNTGIEMNVSTALWTDPSEFETSFDGSNGKSYTTYCERTRNVALDMHNFNGGYLLVYDVAKAETQDDGTLSGWYQELFVTQRDELFSSETTAENIVTVLNDTYSWYLELEGDYDEVKTLEDGTQVRTIGVSSTIFMPKGQKNIGFIQIAISPNSEHTYIVWYGEPYSTSEDNHARNSAQMCIKSVKYPTH